MKHIQTYENLENWKYNHNVGEYVLCKDEAIATNNKENEKLEEFLNNNIGQIVRFSNSKDGLLDKYHYIVQYKKVPKLLRDRFNIGFDNCRAFSDDEIILSAKTIKELETKIIALKYNI